MQLYLLSICPTVGWHGYATPPGDESKSHQDARGGDVLTGGIFRRESFSKLQSDRKNESCKHFLTTLLFHCEIQKDIIA